MGALTPDLVCLLTGLVVLHLLIWIRAAEVVLPSLLDVRLVVLRTPVAVSRRVSRCARMRSSLPSCLLFQVVPL